MSVGPAFLSLELIDELHARSLAEHGGMDGVGDPGGLESAALAAQNVYLYERGDLFEMGAAYAFHIAEAQAYLDGNKRTAVAAALTFLEANGVATDGAEPMALYPDMIAIAAGELDRPGLARRIRELFG
jgi:death-on-curing protein